MALGVILQIYYVDQHFMQYYMILLLYLCFMAQFALVILGFLCFHMKIKTICLTHLMNSIGKFIDIALNLQKVWNII